jgi:hypothetical protein
MVRAPFSMTTASSARLSSKTVAAGPRRGIALLNVPTAEMNAVAAGETDALAGHVNQVGDELGNGSFAPRAGDADERDATAFVGRKEIVDNRLADRTRFADAWFEVHQQAGASIDFNDGAALFG